MYENHTNAKVEALEAAFRRLEVDAGRRASVQTRTDGILRSLQLSVAN